MAVRTEMASLIPIVQRLVSDATAATYTNSEAIQEALDAHRTDFDYLPMWHDSDYRRYAARQRSDTTRLLASSQTSQLNPVTYDVPDFGVFYRVGYLANDWVIRSSPSDTTGAESPNVVDVVGATFLFSTTPDKELYLKATGFNVWRAAADLLLETPDTGREVDTQRTRGQVSRTIEHKWQVYSERGAMVNRRKRTAAII
ncbi:MAG: hypothetical protein NUW01_03460 [Gemmatimonadaceae bacterium]|nr:hypothetical protein [Gemmatimonadaceae bacterium]